MRVAWDAPALSEGQGAIPAHLFFMSFVAGLATFWGLGWACFNRTMYSEFVKSQGVMPKRGKCGLCHQPSLLQESHLIGRAMYKMSREKGFEPVVMTPQFATHTQKQVKEYMFCSRCEDLFNKGGERYVTGLVFDGESFPLLDRIKLAPFAGIRMSKGDLEVFSGRKLGIETEKLAYYAVSLVWRSAVHKWRTLGGQTTTVEMEEEHKERLRQYLLGHGGLPREMGVSVTVCTDRESQGWVFTPTLSKGSDFTTHGMTKYGVLVRGLLFHVMVKVPGRFPLDTVCCVKSSEKVLWVRNCREETKRSFDVLNAKARVAENLKKRAATISAELES